MHIYVLFQLKHADKTDFAFPSLPRAYPQSGKDELRLFSYFPNQKQTQCEGYGDEGEKRRLFEFPYSVRRGVCKR